MSPRLAHPIRMGVLNMLFVSLLSCDQHKAEDFSPTSPQVQGALVVEATVGSLPADGFSTTRIEARIDPGAASDRRTIRFKTNIGAFVEPGTDTVAVLDVNKEADSRGTASVFLRSANVPGIAQVIVSVTNGKTGGDLVTFTTARLDVEFVPVQGAIDLTATPGSSQADGLTPITLEARIKADAPSIWKTVKFTTTGGTLSPAAGSAVPTDADRVARAQLTSATTGSFTVTASVGEFESVKDIETVDFTDVTGAIDIEASAGPYFADGFSAVTLEAKISADAPSAWKTVKFTATTGGILSPTAGTAVATDFDRIARAQLTTTAISTITVTATVGEFETASDIATIAFDQRNPDVVRIGTSANNVPADGSSQITVFADIADALTTRKVTFTTSRGKFVDGDGANTKTTSANADAGNRASVRLQSEFSEGIGSADVTASVELDSDTAQSDQKSIQFVRAFPDRIFVTIAGAFEIAKGSAARTVTVTLDRDVGTTSEGTVVEYEIFEDGTTTRPADVFLTNAGPSGNDGTATANLNVGSSAPDGLMVLRAFVTGSGAATAEAQFGIVP